MSQWFTLDLRCPQCGYEWDDLVLREEADKPVPCRTPDCPGMATRIPSRPNVTRRSFVDGTRRFDRLRAQDAIDRAISETRPDTEGAKERAKLITEKGKVK